MTLRVKYSDLSKTGSNLINVESVVDAVKNIIYTRVGEMPFNREFGSRIENYLFEQFSFTVSRLIFSELIYCISRWEKRVEIDTSETKVEMNYAKRSYAITLVISIKGFSGKMIIEDDLPSKG